MDLTVSIDLFSPPPVAIAPPPLPIYVVPEPPAEGYFWIPGHWLWADYGYFWVPGTWVQPPVENVVWTPGYWGWGDGAFAWHEGYWGPHVGFYGGVNYGGGYDGRGFSGGEWRGGVYNVNRSVVNVTNITNVRNTVSFNGGPGGINAAPTAEQQTAMHEHHIEATEEQRSHIQEASKNPAFAAANNHGKPAIAATARPGDFTHGVVAARQAGARNSAAEQHNAAVRSNPALAKNAALPRTQNGAAPTPNAHPAMQGQSQPQHQPEASQHQPEAMAPRPPMNEAEHARPVAAPAVEEQHAVEPPRQAEAPREAEAPRPSMPPHEADTHPRNQPFHDEGASEPRKEPAEHAPEPEGEHRPGE